MGLPWIRLDTSMPDNPKILGLLDERDGHRAAFVWVCCMAYAGKHGTDGFIPANAARFVHGRASDFARLVEVSALKTVPGGWETPGGPKPNIVPTQRNSGRWTNREQCTKHMLARMLPSNATYGRNGRTNEDVFSPTRDIL
jgi:hypothetical protein